MSNTVPNIVSSGDVSVSQTVVDKVALIAGESLPAAALQLITSVCNNLGLATADAVTSASACAVIIGWVKEGERSVPNAVLTARLQVAPNVPVLLLCEEALVAPWVTLPGGHQTLVGAPLTAQRLRARLCTLLTNDTNDVVIATRIWRSRLCANFWIASCDLPSVHCHDADGVVAVLGRTSAKQSAFDALGFDPFAEAGAALGDDAAIVCLSPGAQMWRVLAPGSASLSVWLISALRFPRHTQLCAALNTSKNARYTQVRAAPGDVVAAVTWANEPFDAPDVWQNWPTDEGAPSLLAPLTDMAQHRPWTSATVIEVR